MPDIVRGVERRGRRVKQGTVVYLAAEGAGGVSKRLKAYRQHHDTALPGLFIVASTPNLLTDDDKALAEAVQAGGGALVIVVDTLAQSMPGGDENGSDGIGKALDRLPSACTPPRAPWCCWCTTQART